jgi:hypothetical protein
MRYTQSTDILREILDTIRQKADADLLGMPATWGPLHVAGLIAWEAERLATATSEGRRACKEIEEWTARSLW